MLKRSNSEIQLSTNESAAFSLPRSKSCSELTGIDQVQWLGSAEPSYFGHILVKGLFGFYMHWPFMSTSGMDNRSVDIDGPYTFKHKIITAESKDAAMAKLLFSRFKPYQTSDVALIRRPFLSIVCPPPKDSNEYQRLHAGLSCPLIECFPTTFDPMQKDFCVFYVHGGGFVSGDFSAFSGLCHELARRLRCSVFFPQYRLAPDQGAMKDSVSDLSDCYSFVSRSFKKIACFGDSAGGNLVVLMLQDDQPVTVPVCLVLWSPVTDLSCSGSSHRANSASDVCCSPEVVKQLFHTLLVEGESWCQSSVEGSMDSMIQFPIKIFAAVDEIFLSDAVTLASKIVLAGGDVEVVFGIGVFHTWPVFWQHIAESQSSLNESCEFCLESAKR